MVKKVNRKPKKKSLHLKTSPMKRKMGLKPVINDNVLEIKDKNGKAVDLDWFIYHGLKDIKDFNQYTYPIHSAGELKLSFPLDRYGELSQMVVSFHKNTPFTGVDVIKYIDAFYNQRIIKDIEMEMFLRELDEDDPGYSIFQEAHENGEKITLGETMGDLGFFEGFRKHSDGSFVLILGS
jgi:hypothetical protein